MPTFENKVSGAQETAIYAVSERYTGIWGEGRAASGVYGHSPDWHGVTGESESNTGVMGTSQSLSGTHGASKSSTGAVGESDTGFGVHGASKASTGVVGTSATGVGVEGVSPTGDGVVGRGRRGVVGTSDTYQGVYGWSRDNAGVVGESESMHAIYGVSRAVSGVGIYATNTAGGSAALFEGDVTVTGDIKMPGADVAEEFGTGDDLPAGTVAVIAPDGLLAPSDRCYDTRVVGIISGAGDRVPALLLDRSVSASEARRPVAVAGKAWCLADARQVPIGVGDLLTTSDAPGHAMKVTDRLEAIGSVIGKALTPLRNGTGHVLVLVGLS